ncbi:RNA polymerase sigma factor [Cytophaga hutchinsonii]|jgi:RNA polymerase sigma factor (sigma-70 family)|uniref:RNA polymerase, sigma subunit, ECF family n=1 Tax=Cytophaga hutchinsonii (strain ATCC 33406 / DSM 1761 / CIP 103989 / NBRC 15051 / NCIMB 9469 / D465) TaxID=269798 RepID=A0A6N4SWS4_CYTH3|nr:sigma-70 family RNA polymerase sigma factor [Cytophaga hutchinsonii]ABG60930.1 RNA polymerase, sigma subunit, ECF family [Cytophaga hutchinsonii ATCC 33406]SFX42671.1 RNA polymerase, sigma subunit, ECF family [Cytophaga hutchinsonii ATCC 33406]
MKNAAISDSTLVSQYIQGNEEAFAELIKRHKSKVYSTIYLIVKDRYLAEDLLQDVFIKVIHKMKGGQYNDEGKFLPWVVRIAHNLAIDYFRRNKRYPTIVMDEGMNIFNSLNFSEDSTESIQIKGENEALIRSLIHKLPESQREVVLMRHFSDMSFQEIADSTGVSINTALGRMRYALINLRKELTKQPKPIVYDKNVYPK